MSVNEPYTRRHGTAGTDRKTVVARGFRRPGWKYANIARWKKARRLTLGMLAMRVAGYRAAAIAVTFGTTRNAVTQRLYRLRKTNGKG